MKVILLSLLMAAAIVAMAFFSGFIVIINQFPQMSYRAGQIWNSMGTSVVFFFLDGCLYLYSLAKIRRELSKMEYENAVYWYRMCDLSMSIFFGIGVIYTAIGMQSALTNSLGSITQETAADIGAWGILNRLVRGGIIMALTTTIVGGSGGYLMRLMRHLTIGRAVERERQRMHEEQDKRLMEVLTEIRDGIQGFSDHLKS